MDELSSKYQGVSIEEVEEGWKDVYDLSLSSCMHGPSCQQGPACQVRLALPPPIPPSPLFGFVHSYVYVYVYVYVCVYVCIFVKLKTSAYTLISLSTAKHLG